MKPFSSQKDHSQPFNDGKEIAVVLLADWLDWVTQKNKDVFVALPMIQRGSVWKANEIADLWDSLLRGMPIGSLTITCYETETNEMIRPFGETRAQRETIKKGSLSLLDGQQRTLAMCIGWPCEMELKMDKRVWVDFGQTGVAGQPFRLRVTTQYQPFGFNQNDQSKKLSRAERRKAREAFNAKFKEQTQYDGIYDYKLPLDETEPYGAVQPLELGGLIKDWQHSDQNIDNWSKQTLQRLSLPDDETKNEIEKRIRSFAIALENVFQKEIALVRVKQELVNPAVDDEGDRVEPALVVLFNRIANAGMSLSPSDYIFSLIKNLFPEAHNLVQDLYKEKNIASLLSQNDLVMTAVRLAASTTFQDAGKLFTDYPSPNHKEFGRLLRMNVHGGGDFLGSALMPLIEKDSPSSLSKAFERAHHLLEYRPGLNPPDSGLPKLAFPLLKRELVQVLVFWIHRRQGAGLSEEILNQQFDNSRAEILRFVLFWMLCVEDKQGASKVAFDVLRNHEYEGFPGKELYEKLCKDDKAVSLVQTHEIESIAMSRLDSEPDSNPVRNWDFRFGLNDTVSATDPAARNLYARWFYRKELLLWLQRKTLTEDFNDADPLAGRDEETPYDYDHICPQNDWGRPAYRSDRTPFRDYCEDKNYGIIGNSIGNFRIEDSSSNRSDGDTPAKDKLKPYTMPDKWNEIWEKSAVTEAEADAFAKCSAERESQGCWEKARALEFQNVVEKRAFRLFKQYFDEADFAKWVDTPISTDLSTGE